MDMRRQCKRGVSRSTLLFSGLLWTPIDATAAQGSRSQSAQTGSANRGRVNWGNAVGLMGSTAAFVAMARKAAFT